MTEVTSVRIDTAMKKNYSSEYLLAPAPVVLVSTGTADGPNDVTTCAWSGNVCSDPPTVYVSLRPERYAHELVEKTGEFTLNLTTKDMLRAVDLCGMYTGRATDKWALASLTREAGIAVRTPSVAESPVSFECKVIQKIPLGSHDMYLGKICAVSVDEQYLDEYGRVRLNDAQLLALVRTSYLPLGGKEGDMGFTIRTKTGSNRTKKAGVVHTVKD